MCEMSNSHVVCIAIVLVSFSSLAQNHFSECRNLDKCDTSAPFNINAPSDRQVVVNLLIHSSDLSAQCFPTSVASVWEERITREFENQAAREKALGIPVAEFMQNLANPILRRQNQVNFIDVVLIPWSGERTRTEGE